MAAVTEGVRYSQGKKDIGEARNFPWEYPIPSNGFWDAIPFDKASCFHRCFSADELAALPIDPDSEAELAQKYELLLKLLRGQLAKKEADSAPQSLYDADYAAWENIHRGMWAVQQELGREGEDEGFAIVQMLVERRKDKSNLSLVYSLASVSLKRGDYGKVVEIMPEVIAWLDSHASLGRDSPQALGGRRMLAEALWRLGRKEEAEKVLTEIRETAEGIEGKFAPYRDAEVKAARELSEKLRATEQ